MNHYENLERLHGKELETYLDELVKFFGDKLQATKDLIDKHKLTNPEPKYKQDDIVFMLHHDMVQTLRIHEDASNYPAGYYYLTELGEICEAVLFPTRQALIEHQLQYWRGQLEDELEQHVSPYCEPKPDCQKCHNYRNANNKLGYDCLCNEMKKDSQSNQPQVDVDRCQHEYDGKEPPKLSHFTAEEGCVFVNKCIKCGGFYR